MLASEMVKQLTEMPVQDGFEAERQLQFNLLICFLLAVRRGGGRLAVDMTEDALIKLLDNLKESSNV